MPGTLHGLEVVDLSWGIAGPITTMLLADNGARVTRVEPPDDAAFAAQSGDAVWHRGTRSAVLDLRDPADREVVAELALRADVVVESFSPGVTARFGLDEPALRAANPRLVYCSITGYGSDTSLAGRPGYDALVMARTGLFHDQRGRWGGAMEYLAGRPGPNPGFGPPEDMARGADRDGPVFCRSTWPSLGAAYLASLGIAAALRAREHTGRGQWVQTSLLQGALAAVGLNWQRVQHPEAPLYWMWPVDGRSIEGLYECADGRWVHHWTVRPSWVLAASEGDELVVPDAATAYRDDPDRLGMGPEDLVVGTMLHPMLAERFARFPSHEWVELAERSGMGVAVVRSPAEALADPDYLSDGCVVELDHPDHGPIRHVGPVLEFGRTPGGVQGPTPQRGRHTDEVRAEARRRPAPPRHTPAASSPPASRPIASPLDGIRVLDLGLGVAGPWCPKLLADLGADVVKVHALHDTFWAGTHMGLGTNRGKRSISLDLKDPRGIEVLHGLIATADVLTHNWRPGAAARLGIDFASLHEHHRRLVVCNTRGYERGPRAALPGTDQTAAALTGVEWEDGACDAGNPPLWSRSGMGDTGNAFLAAIGITQALFERERTGLGQEVGTSIVNADLLNTSYAWIHADGRRGSWRSADGAQFGLDDLYRLYRTADGWVFVAAVTESHRRALAELTGGALDADSLTPVFAGDTAAHWFAALDGAGVPVEIVDEDWCRGVFDDPELIERGWVALTWAGGVGTFEDPGLLVDLSDTPGVIQRGPCLCGEHTREILRELGYDDITIDELAARAVVLDAPVDRS